MPTTPFPPFSTSDKAFSASCRPRPCRSDQPQSRRAIISAVCVYCSSSDRIDRRYFRVAAAVGHELAARDLTLVYGGGGVGLMGEIARAMSRENGRIVGVIPEFMRAKELAFEQADELIVTQTMRERKAVMEQRSDAFLVLPGGFGTLEEIMEIITLKQLALHNKPVVFLNENHFFDPLFAFFENFFDQNFARPIDRNLYKTAANLDEAFLHLLNPNPEPNDNLWHVTT